METGDVHTKVHTEHIISMYDIDIFENMVGFDSRRLLQRKERDALAQCH